MVHIICKDVSIRPFVDDRHTARPFIEALRHRSWSSWTRSWLASSLAAHEKRHSHRWVSRLVLIPKPWTNKWRLIIALRSLNRCCPELPLAFETRNRLRRLTTKGDYLFSMNPKDGPYAVSTATFPPSFTGQALPTGKHVYIYVLEPQPLLLLLPDIRFQQ